MLRHFRPFIVLRLLTRAISNLALQVIERVLDVLPNSARCEHLQRHRSASWVKVSLLPKNADRKPPITAN